MAYSALLQARLAAVLCISVSASLPGLAIATPVASASVTKSTPTPTATSTATPRPLLIAIDNLVATDSTQFSTDFDAFAPGALAENLTVSGMTFTPDPPGTWQVDEAANTFQTSFQNPFRNLTGNLLHQTTPGTLMIAFTSPINAFSCNFAADQPPGTSSLIVQRFSGTTLVGSASQVASTGDVFGEGSVDFASSTPFNKVRLSSVYGTPSPTPTPTPHLPSRNPTEICCGTPNTVPSTGAGLPLGNFGSSCSIADQDSRWVVALLVGVSFLMRFARDRR